MSRVMCIASHYRMQKIYQLIMFEFVVLQRIIMKDIIKFITTKPYIFISIPISFLLFLFILLIDMRFGLLIDF